MWAFFVVVVLFHVICYKDYFEVNHLSLLIPALQFDKPAILYGLRSLYLLIVFLEFVIANPIVEQRFYFIFMSNMIGELKLFKIGNTVLADLWSRNGVVNQAMIFGYHWCSYMPVVYMNFSDDLVQLIAVVLIITMFLMVIHSARATTGAIASIVMQMIFNFSLFYLLCVIYYSDHLHKGFTAEKHTTLNKNSIDFIFGQNEDYAANL